MPESTPPATSPAAPDPTLEAETDLETEMGEPAAPINRAERRRQARQQPGHVGPQLDPTRRSRGPRPHTKRARG